MNLALFVCPFVHSFPTQNLMISWLDMITNFKKKKNLIFKGGSRTCTHTHTKQYIGGISWKGGGGGAWQKRGGWCFWGEFDTPMHIMGTSGHAKSNFQYWVCIMSRLNWGIMVIFCIWGHPLQKSNWFNYFKVFNNLVFEFWHLNFHCQSYCLILWHNIFSK